MAHGRELLDSLRGVPEELRRSPHQRKLLDNLRGVPEELRRSPHQRKLLDNLRGVPEELRRLGHNDAPRRWGWWRGRVNGALLRKSGENPALSRNGETSQRG